MTDIHPYADLVERVYDAVVEPRTWSDVLERFADLLGGSEANLIDQDEVRCEGVGISARSDPAALPLYLNHFIKCSPFLKTTDLPLTLRVLTDEDKLAKSELMRTEYYNDFLKRFDVHSILWVRLALAPGHSTVLTVSRSAHGESFSSAEKAAAECLQPHLVRAWRLSARMSHERPWLDGVEALVDNAQVAIFLVGRDNVVRRTNCAGEKLLQQCGPLVMRNKVLRASSVEATRKLHALIASARATGATLRKGGAMSLPRDGLAPLTVSVVPVRRENDLFGFVHGLDRPVLVCASELERDRRVPEQRLGDLFGFTRMEAQVAAQLLTGHEPRRAAHQLGISYYTVRGHLARMFDKTGVRRQAELVQLLTRAMDQLP